MLVTDKQIKDYLQSANQHEVSRQGLDRYKPSMTPELDKQFDEIVARLPPYRQSQMNCPMGIIENQIRLADAKNRADKKFGKQPSVEKELKKAIKNIFPSERVKKKCPRTG